MTLQEELAKVDAKAQEERAEIETKYRILDALGENNGYSPRIFVHSLYGTKGSVKFEYNWYTYGKDAVQPTPELLRFLLEKFPPQAKTMFKHGSKSFRPATEITPEMEEKSEECLDVCPVTVDLETYQHQTASVEWFAELSGELWRFEVEFPLYGSDLGTLDLRYKRTMGETIVDRCQFLAKHGAQVIRWASGGPQYPNKFTLWWDVDTGKATDFPAIVRKSAE